MKKTKYTIRRVATTITPPPTVAPTMIAMVMLLSGDDPDEEVGMGVGVAAATPPVAEETDREGYPALAKEFVTEDVKAEEVREEERVDCPTEAGAVTLAPTTNVTVDCCRARMLLLLVLLPGKGTAAPVLLKVMEVIVTLQVEPQEEVTPACTPARMLM